MFFPKSQILLMFQSQFVADITPSAAVVVVKSFIDDTTHDGQQLEGAANLYTLVLTKCECKGKATPVWTIQFAEQMITPYIDR